MAIAKVPWYLHNIESDHNIFFCKKYPNSPTKKPELYNTWEFNLYNAIVSHFKKVEHFYDPAYTQDWEIVAFGSDVELKKYTCCYIAKNFNYDQCVEQLIRDLDSEFNNVNFVVLNSNIPFDVNEELYYDPMVLWYSSRKECFVEE